MSASTDALIIIEDRITKLAAAPSDQLYGEVDMAIEMAYLFGALSCNEHRHFMRRRNLIREREAEHFQQLLDSSLRRSA